jgi:hypothetical protein
MPKERHLEIAEGGYCTDVRKLDCDYDYDCGRGKENRERSEARHFCVSEERVIETRST